MRGLEFSIIGLEDHQRRLRDDRRGHTGVAVAVILSLFVLLEGRTPPPTGGPAAAGPENNAVGLPQTPQPPQTPPTAELPQTPRTPERPQAPERPQTPEGLARMNADPTRLVFSPQPVGTSSNTQEIRITNTGTKNFAADYAWAVDAEGAQFEPTNCERYFYLHPQENRDPSTNECTISIVFHPNSPGAHQARLAGVINFKDGEPQPRQVILRNTGAAPVSIRTANITGADAARFRVDADSCRAKPIAGGAQCAVIVRHMVSTAALDTADLVIEHTAADSPVRISLSWAPTPTAAFAADPSSLDFGSVVVGAQQSQRVTFTNVGSAAAKSLATGLAFQDASSFRVGANGCRGALPQQAQCTVEVVFAPTEAAALRSNLFIVDAPLNGLLNVAVSGFAEAPVVLR